MKSLSLFQEFDIVLYESDEWTWPEHQHNFFEIVYILEGEGKHILNENSFPYSQYSLFLLTPNDTHRFEIKERSKFCIITFNKIYFTKSKSSINPLVDFSELFKKLELAFSNSNAIKGSPDYNLEDSLLINNLINQLIKEQDDKKPLFEVICQNCIFMILTLIARNIIAQLTHEFKANSHQSEIAEMVFYIQQHIYEKEKLRIEAIAEYFNKSPVYVSAYFKEHTGIALKEYINQYKLNLIKKRLQYSDLTISQIADELGFTDESHLNKTFKQAFNMSAKDFKRNNHLS